MKFLTVLLLLFSFKVQAITHTEIDALTVNKAIYQLMLRLELEHSVHYQIEPKSSESDPRSNYDRLIMLEDNIKPTFPALQNELTTYQAELHIEEDARIADVIKRKNWMDRLDALPEKRSTMTRHLSIRIPAVWENKHIKKQSTIYSDAEIETHILAIEAFNQSVIVPEIDAAANKKSQWRAARDFVKAYNCATLGSAYARNLCRFQQGR